MFGNPLGGLLNAMEEDQDKTTSASTLKLIEGVLEFIRGNLSNIARTWGTSSPQYRSAREIMEKYFDENLQKMQIDPKKDKLDLADLLGEMSLDGKSS